MVPMLVGWRMPHAALATIMLLVANGCSVVKATQQPGKRDLSVLAPGMPRTHVIAELGPPIYTEQREGWLTDVYSFKQGYSKATKVARATVHGAADFATFGLWEVVGTPTETIFDGRDVKAVVHYQPNHVVATVEFIRGAELTQPSALARWLPARRRPESVTVGEPPVALSPQWPANAAAAALPATVPSSLPTR